MRILDNGALTEEFINGFALPNLRELLEGMYGDRAPRSNSRAGLLEKAAVQGLTLTLEELQRLMWSLFDERLESGFHIMVLSATDLIEKLGRGELADNFGALEAYIPRENNVDTGKPLDMRRSNGAAELLFLSETISTFRAPNEDEHEETERGTRITKVSYESAIPIVSKVELAPRAGTARVIMKPVRQGGHPGRELPPIRTWVEGTLNVNLPPWGVRDGIKKLKELGRLKWRDVSLYEADADAFAKYKPPIDPTRVNAVCVAAERSLDQFDLEEGTVFLDDETPFRVDCKQAVFSFHARTHLSVAENVIQTVRAHST